jgi:hypothetical protein
MTITSKFNFVYCITPKCSYLLEELYTIPTRITVDNTLLEISAAKQIVLK